MATIPTKPHSHRGRSDVWTNRIHQVVELKLSYAVVPSRAQASAEVPAGGCHEPRLRRGETRRSVPSCHCHGENRGSVAAYASNGSALPIQPTPRHSAPPS